MLLGFARRLARWPGTVRLIVMVGMSAALFWAKSTMLPDPNKEMKEWEWDTLGYHRAVIDAEHDLRGRAAVNSTLAFEIGADEGSYRQWLNSILDRTELATYASRPRADAKATKSSIRAIRASMEASRVQDIRVQTDIVRLLGSLKQHEGTSSGNLHHFPTDRFWTPVKAILHRTTRVSLVETPYMMDRLSGTIYWLTATHVRQSARLWKEGCDIILAKAEDMGLWPNSWICCLSETVKQGPAALFSTGRTQTDTRSVPGDNEQTTAAAFPTKEVQTEQQAREARRAEKKHARDEMGQLLMAGPWV